MERQKVTGEMEGFTFPHTQRARRCHRLCDLGKESTKERWPEGRPLRSLSPPHISVVRSYLTNIRANLIFLAECTFMCFAFCSFV